MTIDPTTIAALASELQGYPLAPERLGELGAELAAILADLDRARADLPFEAEPADMLRAMAELAPET